MPKIIAIINQKGGVGKTATACNLAYCFAQKNKSTLLVDLDPSANATHIFTPDQPPLTTKDFLLSKEIKGLACIQAECQGNMVFYLSIVASHISLALTEREIGNRPFRETLLSKKLHDPDVAKHYDHIILDCPPTLTTLTINAMFAADFVLIPVTYEKDALEGVADLFDILSEIKEGHTYDFRIVRNRYDARKKMANGFIAEKLQPFIEQDIVLKTIIRQDENVNKATMENQTIMGFSPKSFAANDYRDLATELEDLFNG